MHQVTNRGHRSDSAGRRRWGLALVLLLGVLGCAATGDSTMSSQPSSVAASPKATSILSDLRARFRLKSTEHTSPTDETLIERTHDVLTQGRRE